MGVLAVFAYGLVAFGPVGALFVLTVARQAHEILVVMSSAFFWLVSLFLSAVIWIIVPPLRDTPAFALPFSVVLQELFRWAYYRLVRRADKVLMVVSDDKSLRRKHKLAYVSGMGFGILAGVVSFANVLKESGGPGVVGMDNSGSRFFFLYSAFGTNVIILLHICWTMVYFDGLETLHRVGFKNLNKDSLQGYFKVFVVLASHMIVSLLSLLNAAFSPVYFVCVSYFIAFLLMGYALHTAGARITTLKYFFTLTDKCAKIC